VACWRSMPEDMVRNGLPSQIVVIRPNISLGKTIPLDGLSDEDLDIETLTQDLEALLSSLFPNVDQAPTFLV
jgi:hypothetical protein